MPGYSTNTMNFDGENVRRAFAWRKTPEPVVPIVQISSSDEEDALWLLSRDWRDLTWDDWNTYFRGLHFLTHEELAYYMPSIMLLSMEQHNEQMLAVGSLLMMLSKVVACTGISNEATEDSLRLTEEECEVLAEWLQRLGSLSEYETGTNRARIDAALMRLGVPANGEDLTPDGPDLADPR